MTGMMDPQAPQRDRHLVVLTDLDGTLLDQRTCSFSAANEALNELQRHKVPIVLCSRRTRIEIELIQLDLHLRHPFISENGSALFIPRNYFPFGVRDARSAGGCDVVEFGIPFGRLVESLRRVAGELSAAVVITREMQGEPGTGHCQCDSRQGGWVEPHEYDVPFRLLDSIPRQKNRLFSALRSAGLNCARGNGCYRVTGVTDRGLAVRRLRSLCERAWGDVLTVGLGDSSDDLPLLLRVDIPFVVRNLALGISNQLCCLVPRARMSSAPGPQGWNEMMLEVLAQYMN